MDTVDSVLCPIRREREERRDPLEVFREFLSHLGRAAQSRVEKPSRAPRVMAGLDPVVHDALPQIETHHGHAGQARG
jgi:hypothetical protein